MSPFELRYCNASVFLIAIVKDEKVNVSINGMGKINCLSHRPYSILQTTL